jgi:hypothetical protein
MAQGFSLARIGEMVATPASKKFTGTVEQRDATPTVLPASIDGTPKPRATATKVTFRPDNWHALLDELPLAILRRSRLENQYHSIGVGAHVDAAERLSAPSPRIRKALACVQPSLPMPTADIDRRAAFARRTSMTRPTHYGTTGELRIGRVLPTYLRREPLRLPALGSVADSRVRCVGNHTRASPHLAGTR